MHTGRKGVVCCIVDRLLPYETMTLVHKFLQLDTAMDGLYRHSRNKLM